jgi:hypothetical protein
MSSRYVSEAEFDEAVDQMIAEQRRDFISQSRARGEAAAAAVRREQGRTPNADLVAAKQAILTQNPGLDDESLTRAAKRLVALPAEAAINAEFDGMQADFEASARERSAEINQRLLANARATADREREQRQNRQPEKLNY